MTSLARLKREVFEAVPEEDVEGFAIETGLNWACRQIGGRITTTVLFHLKHLVKEKKRGLVQGFRARYRMFAAVFGAYLVLQFKAPPLRADMPEAPGFQPELEYINF